MKNYTMLASFIFIFSLLFSCDEKQGQQTSTNNPDTTSKGAISLSHLTTFEVNQTSPSSAEIVSYDKETKKLFVVNSLANQIEILAFTDPGKITHLKSVSLKSFGGGVNSVSVKNKIVAVALENFDRHQNGLVAFFDTEGNFLKSVKVGVIPDMITFTPDGKMIITANEGEPTDDYSIDPEGSISLIDISEGISALTQEKVYSIDFKMYNDSIDVLRKRGIRIFGPRATVAKDLEPEYVAVSPDSKTAWITLQENNAIVKIDIGKKKILSINNLGARNFIMMDQEKDKMVSCQAQGIFQPDGITSFISGDETFIITANEGDVRRYPGYTELPAGKDKKGKKVIKQDDTLFCYGSRSFAIWDANVNLLFDSQDQFDRYACNDPEFCKFNEKFSKIREKGGYDKRGPEPESVTTGKINDKIYAFIALEQYGGVMVYDVTDPRNPTFVQYINSRSGDNDENLSKPEGILFIYGQDSPDGKNLLVLANEGTSTIDVFEVKSR